MAARKRRSEPAAQARVGPASSASEDAGWRASLLCLLRLFGVREAAVSACARCGLPADGPDITGIGRCYARLGSDSGDLACRDRELANLRSLLRSVTGKLEEAAELTHYNSTAGRVEALINQVLEVLS